jgi:hypothetical protein
MFDAVVESLSDVFLKAWRAREGLHHLIPLLTGERLMADAEHIHLDAGGQTGRQPGA